jgi:WD40 repeat protein
LRRPITAMKMLEDAGHLLSTSLDGTLRVWNYTSGVVIKQFEHREEMRCLAYRCAGWVWGRASIGALTGDNGVVQR